MAQPYKVLISRSALFALVLEEDEAIERLFQMLQQDPKPFIPYLTKRAIDGFQELLEMETGVDAATLVRSFYNHFQVVKVVLPHVRTAKQLNWPDLERAIDYSVAMAEKLDAIVFLEPVEAKGTQDLVMTVTPDGLMSRLDLEQSWKDAEAASDTSDRDFLAQVLLWLTQGMFGQVSGQGQSAPPPTAIGKAEQPVAADVSSQAMVPYEEQPGLLAEPNYQEGLELIIKIDDKECPLRVYGPSLQAMLREKEAERNALNTELSDRQEGLDALVQEIEDFDAQFKQQVGVLYVDLLNLKALYWRECWGEDPTLEMILKQFYEEARQRQQEVYGEAYDADESMWMDWESFKAGKGSREAQPPTGWKEELTRRIDPQLKEIRRRIAKRISPDYVKATGDAELIQRHTELMQRVNQAVEEGDLATLERIEAQLYGFLDEEAPANRRVQLQRLLEEISRLREHISEVEREMEQRLVSDTYQQLQNLQEQGELVQTFLARQVQWITAQIEEVQEQLKQFRQQKTQGGKA